jgi:hypothetical protein
VAAHELLSRSISLDNDQRNELEAIIHDLEDENHLLQNEYERLCQEHMEKSIIINEHSQLDSYHDHEMLREAKHLRQHKIKLEQRMKILEEHNKQLEKQLIKSKQLLFKEVTNSFIIYQNLFYCIYSFLRIAYVIQSNEILNDNQVIIV